MELRYRHTVLALGVGANFAQFGSRVVISPVVPSIIETFSVSKGAIGLVLTGMWAVYALLQFPSGVLADHYGERRVVLAALLFTGLGSLLVALSPSFLLFGVFTLLLGAGAGLYTPVGSALLSKLFDDVGQALGIHAMGGPSAALVIPISAALVSARYGWNAALLLGAVVAFPALGLWAWRLRPTPPSRPDRPLREGLRPDAITGLLFRPSIAFTVVLATLVMFAFQSFLSFLPTFLVEYHGFSTPRASAVFGVGAALSIVAMPLMGRLSDVLSRDAALLLAMLSAAGGFVVFLGTSAGLVATAAGVLAFGVGFAWAGPLQGRFTDLLTESERATGFGLVRSVYVLLGSAGSAVTGILADTAGWPVAYGVATALLVVAAAALVLNRALGLEL
jgi:predicted MFS family arabinose efflux permease